MTTIFGPDVSSYEAGLDLSRLHDAAFVIAKASEGTYYQDKRYAGWRAQAKATNRLFAWYHFLTEEDVDAQVANLLSCVGDRTLPGMLDVEPQDQTGSRPGVAQVLAFADAAHAKGLNLRLAYLPRWYWAELGSPSLAGIGTRRMYLVSSAYPGGSGTAPQEYPGDSASGWKSYGGLSPLLYQFTNNALDGGLRMDYNAFRGSLPQLGAYLVPSPTNEGEDMPLTQQDVVDIWDYKNPAAGDKVDMRQQLVNAATGAAASSSKLDQVLALLKPTDPAALAAALGPLLHPTTDVAALAAALAPHLPVPDAQAFAAELAPALVAHVKVVST